MDDYNYEILESNGYLDHQNQLKDDDELSFRPYYSKQISPAAIGVELNTMRLMDDVIVAQTPEPLVDRLVLS